MLGCALFKVLLREPLTCLELETAWAQARAAALGFAMSTEQVFSFIGHCNVVHRAGIQGLSTSCSEKTVGMPLAARRLRDPDINPCLPESDASTRCMNENSYDKERCSTYFLKYKNCRKFWNTIMVQRRQNGVKPYMPTAAERDEILGAMGKMPY